MRFRDPLRLAAVLGFISLLAACDDLLTQPHGAADPAFTILDGARGGNTRLYFLPPMVPAPTYSGTFDATQSPVVQICELSGSTCGAMVSSFSGSAVKVDVEKESYSAVWKTKDAGLDPTKTYRIQVLLGSSVLGYADVVVLSNGSQIKTVDKNQFVATITGGVLNVRFRIERATPPPPPPPPPQGVWRDGDVISFGQLYWGERRASGTVLDQHYDEVYASTFGLLEVGIPGLSGFSMTFTSAHAFADYLPATGTPGVLNADLLDPSSSAAGAFGGEIIALALNIDFGGTAVSGAVISADGERADIVRFGRSAPGFGDLTLCNFVNLPFNGLTVRQLLDILNTVLGGETANWDIRELHLLAADLNAAFADGVASAFAQQHLAVAGCQPVTWSPGDVMTLTQERWGNGIAAQLLLRHYDSMYASSFGLVEVGLTGLAGNSITFSSSFAAEDYLPSSGPPAPLNADLVDPLSSVSGIVGGEVLALRFNIDFADAGYILGASGVRFGDLTLCGLAGALTGLNGLSIRAFSDLVNTALGGGATPYTIADLSQIAFEVDNAFVGAVPTSFAQQHLLNGACPPTSE